MDFFQIAVTEKKGVLHASPDFIVARTEDLMVRGGKFYAIWDQGADNGNGMWSTDEYDVQRLVDEELKEFSKKNPHLGSVKYMRSFSTNGQTTFRKFMSQIGDNAHQLDESLAFQGTRLLKKDYASKRLPYALAPGDHSAWDELVGTLYKPDERAKIEWFLGSIVSGDSKTNQKFIVLYGPPGAGKGTIINIILKLFPGYITTFDAKALGSNGNQFATSAFESNPLVAIQHDGDLSRIEDNTVLNSIISHEIMKINQKFRAAYDARILAALIMGTNKPVKITDAQSGLIRRLIDVHPSGDKLPPKQYHALMARIEFELGAIAHHCLQTYKRMGKNYYSNYQPMEMMYQTNAFVNFIDYNYDLFKTQDGVSAQQAWKLYKEYCDHANIQSGLSNYAFKSELRNYFDTFHDRITLDGVSMRSYYSGFKAELYKTPVDDENVQSFQLALEETTSLLDLMLADCPAQYSSASGAPRQKWVDVKTTLAEIDTTQEHFVKGFAENHIIIDFDLVDEDGKKSKELNLTAAAEWPHTYAEFSRSGEAVHLHYLYDGDVTQLDSAYAPGIEIKVYTGNSALRRRLSFCNNVPIATINSGLPFKEKKRVLDPDVMVNEKTIRKQIEANLHKEYHPGTKPSIDFIKKILDEAYESGTQYDVTDLRQKITIFANNSTNKALECLKIVQNMKFSSEDNSAEEVVKAAEKIVEEQESRLVFYDLEVYPNLFVACWKFEEDTPSEDSVVRMINPKPHEIEALMRLKLVGFNNRSYDNHILWAAAMGFSNEQLYNLSKKIIDGSVGAKFGEAYRISWTDVYDYSTKKQGLKKWQIELGLEHREMDIPWDEPVPEDRIMDVVEYCVNDVVSLEKVHKHLQGDYKARLLLADLSGLTPNDTTAKNTAAIVFGRDYAKKNPQREFVYTDLSKEFPGYVFGPKDGVKGNPMQSTYRGEVVGEGGYVYAEPGIYQDVALLDVASMHPTSIGQLNLFGDEYTPRFMALVEAQLVLKHFYPEDAGDNWTPDFDTAKTLLGGKLRPYVEEIQALHETNRPAAIKATKELRYGLKIAVNIVYGLTSAKFDNPFRDIRNIDNIVAKRGALFMVDLKHFIQEQGYTVAHIKTDSVKIPNATPEIIEAVKEFSAKYGYAMEYDPKKDHYSKMALVNDAVYVAKQDECISNCWTATGKEFQVPYVFKTLFGYTDDINFNDLGETKHVQQGALYLDFGAHHAADANFNAVVKAAEDRKNGLVVQDPDPQPISGWMDAAAANLKAAEKSKDLAKLPDAMREYEEALGKLIHVGKTGRFTPVKEGYGGGQLWRIKDGKHYAVQGTKGYLWVDSVVAANLPDEAIDYDYFERQVADARESLAEFLPGSGFNSVDEFVS